MGARRDGRRPIGRSLLLALVAAALAVRRQRLDAADAAYPHIAHPT